MQHHFVTKNHNIIWKVSPTFICVILLELASLAVLFSHIYVIPSLNCACHPMCKCNSDKQCRILQFYEGVRVEWVPNTLCSYIPKSPHYLYVIFKISSPKAATTSFYSQYLAYISRISASFSLPIESQNPDNSHTISTQQNIELAELLLENRNSVNSWKLFCSNITRERLTSLSYKQKILGLFAQLSPIIYSGIFFLQGFRWFLCLNSI